jgi:uncharacterized protein YozE (UPF0346 family)
MKPKTSAFYRWLVNQKDRNDPIGDLSNDILLDKNFPLDTSSLNLLRDHLTRKSACNEAIQALEEAHQEFNGIKNNRSGLSLSMRFDVFRRDGYRCQICGITAIEGSRLEVDHKTPVVKGGTNEMGNLWTLCFECNRGKGIRTL